jgi:hypothetical protein
MAAVTASITDVGSCVPAAPSSAARPSDSAGNSSRIRASGRASAVVSDPPWTAAILTFLVSWSLGDEIARGGQSSERAGNLNGVAGVA